METIYDQLERRGLTLNEINKALDHDDEGAKKIKCHKQLTLYSMGLHHTNQDGLLRLKQTMGNQSVLANGLKETMVCEL